MFRCAAAGCFLLFPSTRAQKPIFCISLSDLGTLHDTGDDILGLIFSQHCFMIHHNNRLSLNCLPSVFFLGTHQHQHTAERSRVRPCASSARPFNRKPYQTRISQKRHLSALAAPPSIVPSGLCFRSWRQKLGNSFALTHRRARAVPK